MRNEPESLILPLLRDMRAEIGDMRATMATKADVADLRSELLSEMTLLRADVAADMNDLRHEIVVVRKDLGEQIVELRRAIVEYHTTVIGHGIIGELEARLRRLEQRLDLAAGPDAH